ncbi:hypothetical protein [Aromatoleum evansii]|uniref:hypothetical protein n=1 Tax=Aromatoleum evansii TaxID=59406 RepID=UPI00145D3267|nr:hypothetical protein [Aromatoleum evansii]NMG28367.1 hypothetical protein [Aromatoleum evansii]
MVKRTLLATVFVASALLHSPAHAGAAAGGATEVTQILNNIQLLMQSVTQEMQYATDVEHLVVNTLQQVPGSDTSLLADVAKASNLLSSAQGATRSLESLKTDLGSLETHAQRRYDRFIASGLTWSDYVAREKEIAAQDRRRAKAVTQAEEAAMQRVKETWGSYQRYQREITTSQGEHQSMRILNGQMNALIGTMNTVLDLSTVRSNVETEKNFKQSLREAEEMEQKAKLRDDRVRHHDYAIEQLKRLKSM